MKLLEVAPTNRNFKMMVTPEVFDNYNNDLFERYSLELLSNHLNDRTLFIDIGAHFGYYSLLAGAKYLGCQIMAFEPSPLNYEILKNNVALNGLNNIEVYDQAVSSKDDVREFIVTEHSDNCGFYGHPFSKPVEKIIVKTIAIDSLIKDTTAEQVIIKVDVEGHEMEVLDGMKSLLKNVDKVELFIEFNPKMITRSGHEPEDLLRLIDSMGFDLFVIDDDKRETYKMSDPKRWKSYFEGPDLKKGYFNILCTKKAKSLSLCIFSHSSQLEGAERGLLEMVTELIRDHHVLCTVVLPAEGPLREKLESVGASTLIIGYHWWCQPVVPPADDIHQTYNSSFDELYGRIGVIEKINPDIVLTNTMVIPWGVVTSMMLNKPHVWYVREFGELDHGLKFFIPLKDVTGLIKRSNLIITNSYAVRNILFSDVTDNITTIYNYINIPPGAFDEISDGYFTKKDSVKLIITGNITDSKGQKDAILAVKRLVEQKQNVELAIMGTSNPAYLKELNDLVRDNNLEPYVKFFKFATNPYPIVSRADIVLLCSKNEAFGRVIVEAMLLKKPVIGTKSGGAPELIKERFNGLLYEPGNADQLAEKIEYLIQNRDEIHKLGDNGYDFAHNNFTKERYGGAIYEHLIERKGAKNNYLDSLSFRVIQAALYALRLRESENGKARTTYDEEIRKMKKLIVEKESKIADLEARTAVISRQNQEMEREIAGIKGSITWRFILLYHNGFVEKVLPKNSRRRRIYDQALFFGRDAIGSKKSR